MTNKANDLGLNCLQIKGIVLEIWLVDEFECMNEAALFLLCLEVRAIAVHDLMKRTGVASRYPHEFLLV
jgi:hypothetical protein